LALGGDPEAAVVVDTYRLVGQRQAGAEVSDHPSQPGNRSVPDFACRTAVQIVARGGGCCVTPMFFEYCNNLPALEVWISHKK
jgi:hypothetical protein